MSFLKFCYFLHIREFKIHKFILKLLKSYHFFALFIINCFSKDLRDNFDNFSPNHLMEILEGLATAKFKDDLMYMKISQNIEAFLQIYEKNIPDIIHYFGKNI